MMTCNGAKGHNAWKNAIRKQAAPAGPGSVAENLSLTVTAGEGASHGDWLPV
jgi:hypothetical protein